MPGNESVPKSELYSMLQILSQAVEKSTSAVTKKSAKAINKVCYSGTKDG